MRSTHKVLTSVFASILIACAWLTLPQDSHAMHSPALYFEQEPHVVMQENMDMNMDHANMTTVQTTVRNADHWRFNTPLCVTEWVNGQAWHRGCVPSVEFNGQESFSFNTTRDYSGGTLSYTYRTPDGNWQAVMQSDHTMNTYSVPS